MVQRQVRTEQAEAAALLGDLEVQHRRYWELMGKVTGLASRVPLSVPSLDVGLARELSVEYESVLDEARSLGDAIRVRLQDAPALSGGEAAVEYRTGMLDLERNGDRNLGHQVRRLAEPLAAGVDPAELLRRRQLLANILVDWNTLFAQQLIECDDSFSGLRRALERRRDAHADRWRGVL